MLTNQIRKSYCYDKKSKRYQLPLFFHFLDLAIDNEHLLYKHSCVRIGCRAKDFLLFRIQLTEE